MMGTALGRAGTFKQTDGSQRARDHMVISCRVRQEIQMTLPNCYSPLTASSQMLQGNLKKKWYYDSLSVPVAFGLPLPPSRPSSPLDLVCLYEELPNYWRNLKTNPVKPQLWLHYLESKFQTKLKFKRCTAYFLQAFFFSKNFAQCLLMLSPLSILPHCPGVSFILAWKGIFLNVQFLCILSSGSHLLFALFSKSNLHIASTASLFPSLQTWSLYSLLVFRILSSQ